MTRSLCAALAAAILLTTAAAAAAAPADEISELIAQRRYSEARRRAEVLAKRHARDGEVQYLYGTLLLATFELEEARPVLARATELLPRSADAWSQLAIVEGFLGHDDAAAAALARALELDPQHVDAVALRDELEVGARIRAGAPPELAPGSAAHAVYRFFSMLDRGDFAQAFDEYLDPTLFDDLMARVGIAGLSREEAVRSFAVGVRQAMLQQPGTEFAGWEVLPGEESGDRVEVRASLLVRVRFGHQHADNLRALLRSPELAAYVDANVADMYEGLDAADREAYLRRLIGRETHTVRPLVVKLRRDGARWRVYDISVDMGYGESFAISDLIRDLPALARASGTPLVTGGGGGFSYRPRQNWGSMVAIVCGLIAVLVGLARRRV